MTVNSTNSELMQDNSLTEYVSPETNPMDTVQSNELIFGQKHNDIDCALCPTAKRACDRAWFSEAQICEWSGMSHSTMYRRLKLLEEKGRITSCSDLNKTPIPDSLGVLHETTIYNLNVLNQLAMVCIESDVLNETSKKFSDILSEVETTGSYSIRKPDSYMIENPIERAKRWIEETEAWQNALSAEETAHNETKALLAEEKEKVETLNEAVDNLVRTKSWINDKKVASAMGTAGAKAKECERLKKELDKMGSEMDAQIYNAREAVRKEYEEAWMTARDWCYKHGLPVYVNEPKWVVSERLVGICSMYPEREQWHTNAYGVRLFPQWACDILDKVYDEDETFLIEYRTA